MATTTDSDLTAADVAWDLEPLVDGMGEAGVDELLDQADRVAASVAERRGTIARLDAAGLASVMRELASIAEFVGRAASYASLRFAADTTDPGSGALLQHVEERATVINTKILFFELEWAALPDDRAAELVADERLTFCRHYLAAARRYRPHLLTEPEELVMTEKAVTGRSAWSRLFSELTSTIAVDLDGGRVSLEEALSRLSSPERGERRAAAESVTAALEPGLRTRAFVFNTLLADKAVDDRLRKYPHWLASRNLDNEASDESVRALVAAVQARYDIPQRWYALKARVLGLDRLADYDRMASMASEESEFGWREARELVLDAYGSFSSELEGAAHRFFDAAGRRGASDEFDGAVLGPCPRCS